jgi:hypothetical protein
MFMSGSEKMRNHNKGYLKSINFALIFLFILMLVPLTVHATGPNDTDVNLAEHPIPERYCEQEKQPYMNYYEFDDEIISRIWEVPPEKYYAIEFISIHLTQLSGAYPPIVSVIVDNSAKIILPLKTIAPGGTIDRYMFNEKVLMFAWNTVFVQSDVSLSGSVLISGYLFDSQ